MRSTTRTCTGGSFDLSERTTTRRSSRRSTTPAPAALFRSSSAAVAAAGTPSRPALCGATQLTQASAPITQRFTHPADCMSAFVRRLKVRWPRPRTAAATRRAARRRAASQQACQCAGRRCSDGSACTATARLCSPGPRRCTQHTGSVVGGGCGRRRRRGRLLLPGCGHQVCALQQHRAAAAAAGRGDVTQGGHPGSALRPAAQRQPARPRQPARDAVGQDVPQPDWCGAGVVACVCSMWGVAQALTPLVGAQLMVYG
jgi:hypothetical protein